MEKEDNKELAESTRKYVTQFLFSFDKQIIELGPDEAFTEFMCQYGYIWSSSIMKKICTTSVFSSEEYEILNKIESYFYKLMNDHPKGMPWNMLKRHEYLEIKSLIYDYLVLVNDFKFL